LAKLRYEPFGLPPLHPISPSPFSPSSPDYLDSSAAARQTCNPPSSPSPSPPPLLPSPTPPHKPPETASGTVSSEALAFAGDDIRQGAREGTRGARCSSILFDPKVLAAYLLSTYKLLHPISRRKLARSDCQVSFSSIVGLFSLYRMSLLHLPYQSTQPGPLRLPRLFPLPFSFILPFGLHGLRA